MEPADEEPEPEQERAEESDGDDEAEEQEEVCDEDRETSSDCCRGEDRSCTFGTSEGEQQSADEKLVISQKDGNASEPQGDEAIKETLLASSATAGRGGRGWRVLRGLRKRLAVRGRAGMIDGGGGGGDFLTDDAPRPWGSAGASGDCAAEMSADFAWQVVDRKGIVLSEEGGGADDPLAPSSVEAKIEQLLTWMLAPAVHGIPKLGVPGAADRADELLAEHGRDVDAAVREVVAGSERTVPLLVLNFCLERIPVLGCPTVLLRTTWGNLRSILIIAALYGHDLESPRVQHEALLCLVPPGEDAEAAGLHLKGAARGGLIQPALVAETAQKVARMMIKGALRRATGLQAAVDCFELASLLYSSCGQDAVDDDGFVHVLATPASAARDFFRRKSIASCALLWCSLPLLVLGMAAPGAFALGRWLQLVAASLQSLCRVVPQGFRDSAPALLLGLLGLGVSLRTFHRIFRPARGRRSALTRLMLRFGRRREARAMQEAWPRIVTSLVFTLHALLPAATTYSAVSVVLNSVRPVGSTFPTMVGWDILHRLAGTVLGLYSLFSVMVHQLQGEQCEGEYLEVGWLTRSALRLLHFLVAAARGCCVLAAWTYASLALDFSITYAVRGFSWHSPGLQDSVDEARTLFGVVRPLAWLFGAEAQGSIDALLSEKAVSFTLNVVSVASQQRLVELLSRREVLLRLIGAEKMTASTLCLLLKGVAVACSSSKSANPLAEFLTSVAPPPVLCVLIVTAREQALLLGASLVLTPEIMACDLLPSAPSFALGIFAGAYAANALLCMWYSNRSDLDSPALRLALLIPGGVSGRAKGLLRGALVGTGTRAVQMMAMGIIQRAARWLYGPRL